MTNEVGLDETIRRWAEIFSRRNIDEFKHLIGATELSPTQVIALYQLHFRKSSSVSEIASKLGVSIAAASQMIDRLVQFGMVNRSENPSDRRAKMLVLSPKGQELVSQNLLMQSSWISGLADQFTVEQQTQIAASLHMLIEAAQNMPADSADSPLDDEEPLAEAG